MFPCKLLLIVFWGRLVTRTCSTDMIWEDASGHGGLPDRLPVLDSRAILLRKTRCTTLAFLPMEVGYRMARLVRFAG
jgi:hypothetical protein